MGTWWLRIQHIFWGDTILPRIITQTQRFEDQEFIWMMILGSIGKAVEKLDREKKEFKIMFIMEQMTTGGT